MFLYLLYIDFSVDIRIGQEYSYDMGSRDLLSPDVTFQHAAAFQSQAGDFATIRLQAIRMYDINVTWIGGQWQKLRDAIYLAHGFCNTLQITEDFLNFAELMTHIPLVIPSGSSLPDAHFMESDLAEITYHTFEANYYLYSIKQLPIIYINTGIRFPFEIYAQAVLGAQIIYRKNLPMREHPATPYNHERVMIDRWAVDFPIASTYSKNACVDCFGANWGGQYAYYHLYPDTAWVYDGVLFSDEQRLYHALYEPHGIKTTTDGRPYYYGTDDPEYSEDFPYRNIQNPQWRGDLSRYLDVDSGWNSVSGFLYYWTSTELLLAYPPICPTVFTGGIPHLLGGLVESGLVNSLLSAVKIPSEVIWSGKIDGSWRLGYGGHKLL